PRTDAGSADRPRSKRAPSLRAAGKPAFPRDRAAGRPVNASIELPFEQRTLGNGLRVIAHEDHTLPIVAVNLWYHVGSRNEKPGRTGFAHLFEPLMFEGSAHVPAGQFDTLLESVGATNNGSTSTDRTNYWETLPSNALEIALWLESDR